MTTLQYHQIPRDLIECLRIEARNAANPPTEYVLAEDGGRAIHKPNPDLDMAELLDQAANRITADGASLTRLRAELREASHDRDGYHAERDMARERLEWSSDQPYDGIAARDETIVGLQAELARVRKLGDAMVVDYGRAQHWMERAFADPDGLKNRLSVMDVFADQLERNRAALAAWNAEAGR